MTTDAVIAIVAVSACLVALVACAAAHYLAASL